MIAQAPGREVLCQLRGSEATHLWLALHGLGERDRLLTQSGTQIMHEHRVAAERLTTDVNCPTTATFPPLPNSLTVRERGMRQLGPAS